MKKQNQYKILGKFLLANKQESANTIKLTENVDKLDYKINYYALVELITNDRNLDYKRIHISEEQYKYLSKIEGTYESRELSEGTYYLFVIVEDSKLGKSYRIESIDKVYI